MTHHRRRKKTPKPSPRQLAVFTWVDRHMADPVAAKYAALITLVHGGLIDWKDAAEFAEALPAYVLGASVSQSQEPDDRIVAIVERRLDHGGDPEHLDPVRQRGAHRLGDFASWYTSLTGEPDWNAWYYLALHLGRLIGDQIAANALATCFLGHQRLVAAGDDLHRKNARDRWYRLAPWYVKTLMDEQPEKGRTYPSGRPVTQYVEGEGERRYG